MLRHSLLQPAAPSRVVIVGASGFVGAAAKERLERRGVAVVGLGRAEVNLQQAGAADRLAGWLRPDDVVVAAAARAPCRNLDMLIENMAMVRALLEGLSAVPLSHVINISSDAVYGDEPVPLTEESPAAPTSMHGAMHLARERAFQDEVKTSLAILRPTLIYGVRDPHNGYGPNRFRRLAAQGQPIVLFGEGEELRDHVHIDDVAEVIVRTVLHRSVGTLNVASGRVHSFRAIADLAATGGTRKVAVVTTPRTGPMPHNGYRPFDVSALWSAFPDLSPVDLPDGMKLVHGTG
jgi:nucleoside-diphosphate-sugar epimerase